MKRREAIQLTATLLGGTILGSEFFLSGCKQTEKTVHLFSEKDIVLMDEIGETILPDSDRSPGAKAAGIGKFMQTMVTDCYSEQDAEIFKAGLAELEAEARKKYGADFLALSYQQKFDLLSAYDKLAREAERKSTPHFYTMIKQLTILGYFTSEVGQTKALRYNPVPGGFNGNVPYAKGDRAWVGPLCSID